MQGGISLGKYIIVSQWATQKTIMHEYGHCLQSKILGPLYLLVVGLPSILHAAFVLARGIVTTMYFQRDGLTD